MKLDFKLQHHAETARTAQLTIGRQTLATPSLIIPAPALAVHDLAPAEVKRSQIKGLSIDESIVSQNPGTETVRDLGGLHRFMAWDGLVIAKPSDFRHLPLVKKNHLTKDGVRFHDVKTGAVRLMTPQTVIESQTELQPDIMLMLSQTPSYYAPYDYVEKAVAINSTWAAAAVQKLTADSPALFGVMQGAGFAQLRKQSIDALSKIDFSGYVIGGLSDIDNDEEFDRILKLSVDLLPADKVRMVVDVQSSAQLISALKNGIDLIETSLPTHWGRYGKALTAQGLLPIKKARFAADPQPLAEDCHCPVCEQYSRAYLRHLLHVDDSVGPRLISQHNLWYLRQLVSQARLAIMHDQPITAIFENLI
ncbi:tRNA guanosine(34) transglycosylase Tgt [Limosilactobacillus allomucosae]|uniref:tRNA guanosine(34) transglycosylase Tgt n=1 Tax=Limosilactobacillus allomucosae TaxID=3142938 RepID=UPI0032642A73